MSLTAKQAQFVREYLIDMNATQAAIRAGYGVKAAYAIGAENLRKPQIAAALEIAQAERAKRTEITADRVLAEFAKLGFSDVRSIFTEDGDLRSPTELADGEAAAIQSVEVVTRRVPGAEPGSKEVEYVHKIKLADKIGALTQIGRHLGMFVDRSELTGKDGAPLQVVIQGPDVEL